MGWVEYWAGVATGLIIWWTVRGIGKDMDETPSSIEAKHRKEHGCG